MKNEVPMVRLGDLITPRHEKYVSGDYPIRGVTRDGFIPPKQKDADLSLYNVFYKDDFVFNPARMEINSIALNTDFPKAICSSLYEIFFVTDTEILLPEYLNLFLKRDEFSRYCEYDAIGSARNYFRVSNIQNVYIPLPDIEVQRDLVAIYGGLQKIVEENEALIAQLESVCHDFVVDCKSKYPKVKLGDWITECDERNSDNTNKSVRSVSVSKEFKETNAKVNKDELSGYKLVPPNHIAYVQTTKNEKCFANALNISKETVVVSSVDKVITSRDSNVLDIGFVHLFFRSREFDRYAIFNSWGSAREVFSYEELCNVSMPFPPIEIQRAIVDVYRCMESAKRIVADARELMKNICPALVQKAAHSA